LDQNSRYLSAALYWLRLRVERAAIDVSLSGGATKVVRTSKKSGRRADIDNRISHAANAAEAIASRMASPPALLILERTFGLSRFERDVLLLCAAPEFDTRFAGLFARAQLDTGRDAPTFALALRMFGDRVAWEALSPHRPLRHWRLVEVSQTAAQPLTGCALRADERIVNYIKGLNSPDDRLSPYIRVLETNALAEDLSASQRTVADKIVSLWCAPGEPDSIVQLLGADRTSKHLIALHAAARVRRHLYRLDVSAMPTQASDVELLARLWQRECALLPLGLYVDAHDIDAAPSTTHAQVVRRFLESTHGFLLLAVRDAWGAFPRDTMSCDAIKPTAHEQRAEWLRALGAGEVATAALLASQFRLNVPDIRRIITTANADRPPDSGISQERLWDACRARARPALDLLAHRIDAIAVWDDIVLPEAEMRLLRQIAGQVKQRLKVYDDWGFGRRMNRGLGITALFAGESGTGKTMAAEIIATDLRLNLYRIDLSAVVSKYIGETEKNLCRLFDWAEDGGVILLFDEADALFGKRSEVRDSHDRYANIEVNYLLQRMEAFSGLAILATNMRSALDAAFTRRLRFLVNFPFPSASDRSRMWQRSFPHETPIEPLDYGRLARLNLTGGSISNAAVNAAFMAAAAGTPVTMGVALAAARQELIKLDRPINEADFHADGRSAIA
jgi:hypothetical protein